MTNRDVQTKQPLISHQIPTRPWQKVVVDLFRYNKDYLIIVDSHSNYPDLYQIPDQTSEAVIKAMHHSFSQFGVAEELLTENGPCFVSAEYIQIAAAWDFKRTSSSLLYPQSNGLAEKQQQHKNNKNILRKCKDPSLGLLIHRTNPGEHGLSHEQMLMGRKLRNDLPLQTKNSKISENLSGRNRQEAKQKLYFYTRVTWELELLKTGNPIRIRDPIKKGWTETATVRAEVALRSYTVLTNSNTILRRNYRDLQKIHNRIVPEETL